MLRGLNKTFCAPGETEPDLPLSVWVSPAEVRVSSGVSALSAANLGVA